MFGIMTYSSESDHIDVDVQADSLEAVEIASDIVELSSEADHISAMTTAVEMAMPAIERLEAKADDKLKLTEEGEGLAPNAAVADVLSTESLCLILDYPLEDVTSLSKEDFESDSVEATRLSAEADKNIAKRAWDKVVEVIKRIIKAVTDFAKKMAIKMQPIETMAGRLEAKAKKMADNSMVAEKTEVENESVAARFTLAAKKGENLKKDEAIKGKVVAEVVKGVGKTTLFDKDRFNDMEAFIKQNPTVYSAIDTILKKFNGIATNNVDGNFKVKNFGIRLADGVMASDSNSAVLAYHGKAVCLAYAYNKNEGNDNQKLIFGVRSFDTNVRASSTIEVGSLSEVESIAKDVKEASKVVRKLVSEGGKAAADIQKEIEKAVKELVKDDATPEERKNNTKLRRYFTTIVSTLGSSTTLVGGMQMKNLWAALAWGKASLGQYKKA